MTLEEVCVNKNAYTGNYRGKNYIIIPSDEDENRVYCFVEYDREFHIVDSNARHTDFGLRYFYGDNKDYINCPSKDLITYMSTSPLKPNDHSKRYIGWKFNVSSSSERMFTGEANAKEVIDYLYKLRLNLPVDYTWSDKPRLIYDGEYLDRHFKVVFLKTCPVVYVEYRDDFKSVDVKTMDEMTCIKTLNKDVAYKACPTPALGSLVVLKDKRVYFGRHYGHSGDYVVTRDGHIDGKKYTVKEIVEDVKKVINYFNDLSSPSHYVEKSIVEESDEVLKVVRETFQSIKDGRPVSNDVKKKFDKAYEYIEKSFKVLGVFKKYSVAYLNDVEREDDDPDAEDELEKTFDSSLFSGVVFTDINDKDDLLVLTNWLEDEGLFR